MKKLVIYSIFIAGVLAINACENKVLDKKPLDSISSDDVFANPQNATLFVNNIYSNLPNGFERGWYMLTSATSDADNSYAWAASHVFNKGENTPSNTPNNDWSKDYQQINNCNNFLVQIDKTPGDQALIKRLKGEVYFLRAFYYAELNKRFGGVPLITKVLTLSDNFLEDRATASAIVTQIVSDLDLAIAALPSKYTGNDIGRATKVAALALKGRVLLYNEQFDASAKATKLAIDEAAASGYDLYTPYDKIFLDNNNKEIIFDKQLLAKNCSGYQDEFNSPVGYTNGWGGTSPTQNFVDSYDMQTTGKPITDATSGYDPQNPYADRDPRFKYSVLYNGTIWKGRAVDTKINGVDRPNGNGDATKTSYYMRKFMDESIVDPDAACSPAHWVLIRLAEVYLNYAEAQFKLGNKADALVYINKIRARVDMPEMALADLTWDRYMNERRVELAFEEHRFWDVRRWKVAEVTENGPMYGMNITPKTGGGYTYEKYVFDNRVFNKTKHYLFPIPQSEISKNSKLSQNPGW